MKKTLMIILTITLISLLFGCKKLEDYIPKNFGLDDGYLLYSENIKMNSSGGEITYILDEILIDNETYYLNHKHNEENILVFTIEQIYYYKEYIFYLIVCNENIYLIKHDLNDETNKVIGEKFLLNDKPKLEAIINDEIIVSSQNMIYQINYDGEILNQLNNRTFKIDNFEDEYIIIYNNHEIYYLDKNIGFKLIHVNENEGMYIITKTFNKDYFSFTEHLGERIITYVYDVSNGSVKFINDNSSGTEVYIVNLNYFITYQIKTYGKKGYYKSYTINNVLYKYESDNNKLEVYKFKKNKDYINNLYFANNKLYFIRKNSGIFRLIDKPGYFDFDNMDIVYQERPEFRDQPLYEDEKYFYYGKKRVFGLGPTYYFFYRYNKLEKKEELMFYIDKHINNKNSENTIYYFDAKYFYINKIRKI